MKNSSPTSRFPRKAGATSTSVAPQAGAAGSTPTSPVDLRAFAHSIRLRSLAMIAKAKSSHVGSVFSTAEILAVLYGKILSVRPAQPDWPERDRFIMSKGHAAAGLYVALATRGFFPMDWLETFYQDASHVAGHVTHSGIPGVEVSTGSLGHGLAIGCGMALAGQRDSSPHRVFVLLSDGECDEGSVWEAALFAPFHRLENLTVIVDYNKIQSLGTVKGVLDLEPFAHKWKSFGWAVTEIDGHDLAAIEKTLHALPLQKNRPSCIIAHTVKGKGVDFMEHKLLWHYRCPSDTELSQALDQLQSQTLAIKSNGQSPAHESSAAPATTKNAARNGAKAATINLQRKMAGGAAES